MSYHAPLGEMRFFLEQVLGADRLAQTDRFAEATPEMSEAILSEAARLADEIIAPLNRVGDQQGAVLENGVVRTSPGFADGYRAIAEGGWCAMSGDPQWGGMGLPHVLTTCVNEMLSGACLSLALNPLMTQGQIEALEHHGSAALRELYLPKLNSGQWTGTMNLTEPQAGSDVGALRTRAEDNGDGTFCITGQKIYISWGDHDVAENICHLVLARLPDGVPGTKGISLFLVPKYLPDAAGNPGVANRLKTVSLEHKMGLHGSPTAVMAFEGATGWMVGPPHGGMAAMFTMMNNARLGVGVQGLGQAEAAYQAALAYAQERKQGRAPVEGGTGTILDHADVRRMLMTMKALTAMARAICLDCAISLDMARAHEGETAEAWATRAAVLTPLAKGFGTDIGSEVADLGVQVHGGMGYIEETGAAQYLRDVRVTRIYEGTNGIQAMDLVGRKMKDGGTGIKALLQDMAAEAADTDATAQLVNAALGQAAQTTDALVAAEMNDRFAGAVPFARALALTLGCAYLHRAAAVSGDADRAALARFAARALLPQAGAQFQAAEVGAADLYALSPAALGA